MNNDILYILLSITAVATITIATGIFHHLKGKGSAKHLNHEMWNVD